MADSFAADLPMSAWMRLCFLVALFTAALTSSLRSEAAEVGDSLRHETRTPMHEELPADYRVTSQLGERRFVRLPPVTVIRPQEASTAVGSAGPVDGTFRNEGQSLVININGQEYHLQRSDVPSVPDEAQEATRSQGSVHGRLSHGGRPLAGCEVALVRLNKTWADYQIVRAGQPISTVTDSNGVYRFTSVEPGPYKLKWRPAGEGEWIRRAEIRPDVHVRNNEASEVKEVRVALRTIN